MLSFPSQGLSSILNKIESSRTNNNILDMGEMRPGTFNYFSKLSCKIHFENLRELFFEIKEKPGEEFKARIDTYLLEYKTDTKFDVIFLWDLINFLTIDEIVYLFRKLQPYCKSNTLIHSLSYIGKTIPESPSKFQISSCGEIEIQNVGKIVSKKSAITTLSILKNLNNFIMETNLFNSNSVSSGISENIMKYVPHYDNKDKTLEKKNYAFKQTGVESFQRKTSNRQKGVFHYSPALEVILGELRQLKKSIILDLGRDISENNDHLLNYSSKVFHENLDRLINWKEVDPKIKLSRQTLAYEAGVKFDAILVWDLFNYLSIDDVKKIGDRLSAVCKSGTKVYVLAYSSTNKSSRPQSFYIRSSTEVEVCSANSNVENKSKLNSVKLLRSLANTKIKNSFLMQQKMQKGYCEYILEYN